MHRGQVAVRQQFTAEQGGAMPLRHHGAAWLGGCAIVLLWAPDASACQPIFLPSSGAAIGCERIVPLGQAVSISTAVGLGGEGSSRLERSLAPVPSQGRPLALPPLYASFVTLQLLDAHSTISATRSGAEERNPIVAPLVQSPAAVIALKAATTTGAIVLTEKLWRRHRVAAIALMIGINGAYAAIVTHNYRVRR
jgi:hypothetical protein